ncbi:MAG: PQQ-dependent sugar dehydrogenase [Verrucomicrobiota bacterium]
MSVLRRAVALLWLMSGTLAALPADFQIRSFVDGLRDPATMAFSPDGRLFVGERITGDLRIVTASGQLLGTPFLSLDVPPVRHRSGGLRGFAFDPAFPAEPYVYIFYTKQFASDERHNRLSRFTVSSGDMNIGDPTSEVVLLELPFNSHVNGSSGSHNGGAVVFGGDGKLYVTTGDGWNASNGYGAGETVQSLATNTGKVFRINKDGSIPTDNPFYATATGDFRAIYALGLRNPYAATVHPVTGDVFVFDVGTANGGDKDYVYKIAAGENYGHDGYGGIGTSAGVWAYAGKSIVSGGAWYFANQFPATYQGRLFVTSWKQGLKTVASISDTTVTDFGSADVNNQGPLYPVVGPDGSIYFLDSTYETTNGEVFKLSYTNANRAATPDILPNGGAFVDSVAVTLSGGTGAAMIYYTLDGSDPDETSTLYVGSGISVTSSATLRARAFEVGFDASPVSSAVFTIEPSVAPVFTNVAPTVANISTLYTHQATATGTPEPAFSLDTAPSGMTINAVTGEIVWTPGAAGVESVVIRASNGVVPDALQVVNVNVSNFRQADAPDLGLLTQGGLRYSYYEDDFVAESMGVVAVPGIGVRGREDDFRLRFEGYLEVPSAGDYGFGVVTGDTASVLIGGVDVTGGTIGLAAGKHIFAVEYEEAMGPQDLEVRWEGPSGTFGDGAIPSSAFFYYTVPYGIFMREAVAPYLSTFPPDDGGLMPATLTETGAFASLADLEPSDGLIPYTPNAKLWSDGADKRRWIAVPSGETIAYADAGAWVYPPGTVFIKHFEIGSEKRRIETRFEVVKEGGGSYLVTYRWREDQTEADLVPAEGASGVVGFDGVSQEWFFPSRADCVACHNSSVGHVLGSSTRQLNGVSAYPSGVSDNQVRTWAHLGLFDLPPFEGSLSGLDALSGLGETGASLEERARSYFDSNCAYCHNSVAAPEGTDFVLEYDVAMAASGVVGGAVARNLGLGGLARVIAPRDLKHSVLYQRLAGNDPERRMPPIGRTVVHWEAREMLVDWILSLPHANTFVDVTDYSRRWTFDGTTGDGVWRDTVNSPNYVSGQVSEALEFDGSDDAVDLGPLDAPGGSALTITFWFRADDFGTSDARFLSKADGQFDADHYWMVSTLNGTKLRFRLKAGGTTSNLISGSGVLTTGEWTHVAARYDGATMKLYKNGVEVASQVKAGVLDASGTVDAAIGNQPLTASGGARPFDGLIDDVRIYPRALSVGEIATVRDAGQTPNAAPTLAVQMPTGLVGGTYVTRAAASGFAATAVDSEDGDLSGSVTWLSTTAGDVTPATLPDGEHTLVATVRDANGSAESVSTGVYVVPGFEGWAADHGVAAIPSADVAKDGLTLLEEYAYGLTPDGVASGAPVTVLGGVGGALTLRFPLDVLAIDILYRVRYGADPRGLEEAGVWEPMGNGVLMDLSGGNTGSVQMGQSGGYEVEVSSPADSATRRFGTVEIEK